MVKFTIFIFACFLHFKTVVSAHPTRFSGRVEVIDFLVQTLIK